VPTRLDLIDEDLALVPVLASRKSFRNLSRYCGARLLHKIGIMIRRPRKMPDPIKFVTALSIQRVATLGLQEAWFQKSCQDSLVWGVTGCFSTTELPSRGRRFRIT